MQGTYTAKPAEITRSWFIVDATNKPLGRIASDIARVLRGKHKPTYTPHIDTGDFVVVVNADKVALTGEKLTDKMYYNFSGHPGGLRTRSAAEVLKSKPTYLIEKAVRGMLPKNSLGRQMARKLKLYADAAHPHAAQQPKSLPSKF
ncbi:MAG: 50S ribosomal protein L13 [Polyangiales bacterium]|jgi:large subunit ribosomal protein L13